MGFVLEGFFAFTMSFFFNFDGWLWPLFYASTAFNWLPWSIMSVAPGKSEFGTPSPQVGTWKVSVNLGYFSDFLLLCFCPKIRFLLCNPISLHSVCSPLCCGRFTTFGSSLLLFVYELQPFLWGDQCKYAKTTRKWLLFYFSGTYLSWRVQNLLFPGATDMIDQENQLNQLIHWK